MKTLGLSNWDGAVDMALHAGQLETLQWMSTFIHPTVKWANKSGFHLRVSKWLEECFCILPTLPTLFCYAEVPDYVEISAQELIIWRLEHGINHVSAI